MPAPKKAAFARRPASSEANTPCARAALVLPHLDELTSDSLSSEHGRGVRTAKVRKNKDVVISGNHYDCVYLNHDGWLARYKILHNGSRQILDFILPGQVFGLQACLFKRALYSVVTITETSLSTIPFDMVDNVFERDIVLAKALFSSAAYEGAILGEHLIDTARRSAYERVSHLLLELFVRLNRVKLTDEMTFSIPLTQELIADALGLTTVHVNRTLRALREDKLIAMDGRFVTILDFEALSLLSDFENSYLGDAVRTLRDAERSARIDGLHRRGKTTP
ncbi:Crp/Fnr family transcriptional regulator [Bradyrhizobium sp.]|uniref:Crp/Fnr family transcriptional regulator n=1 Tax=Bradyrhizobium sp. TaxID=376 RepID=UPI002BC90C48|nr:Crp/Fnr family transcriptional regulator [Bradyrhizobium sp.]HMM87644.1 Crp/Fnr family transcriptional regulator [Bradyrhizobium sp.]